MKYFKHIVLLFVFLPLPIFALEGVTVNCPDKINKNEEFDCEVIGNASYKVSAIEYEFSLPEYITMEKFVVDSIWQGDEEDNLVLLYTDENKISPFNLGVITLSSSKNLTSVDIKTEYLLFGDDDYVDHILVEKKGVKDVESKTEKVDNKKNNNYIYVIIILIIGSLCLITFIFRKKRVKK